MTIQLLDNVINPESGIQVGPAQFPPMGANPSASGRTPPPMAPPPPPTGSAFAKRLSSLDGKTVYLVDTGFGGSYNFMLQLQKWFSSNMPSVKTIRKRKPGNVFMDDNNELWEEVKQKGDAVVLGVAG
jgi:hypothetical protein